jgi:hypothetical protein
VNGEILLRIIVRNPPSGVAFCIQQGRSELISPTEVQDDALSFEFPVQVALTAGKEPNFLGKFAQGARSARFVYVNSGRRAGQSDSCWDRRAKVLLAGIRPSLVKRALADENTVLEARIEGTAGDGGPACATVPLLEGGWRPVKYE